MEITVNQFFWNNRWWVSTGQRNALLFAVGATPEKAIEEFRLVNKLWGSVKPRLAYRRVRVSVYRPETGLASTQEMHEVSCPARRSLWPALGDTYPEALAGFFHKNSSKLSLLAARTEDPVFVIVDAAPGVL